MIPLKDQIASLIEPLLDNVVPRKDYDSLEEELHNLQNRYQLLKEEMKRSKEAFVAKQKQWHHIKEVFRSKPQLSKVLQTLERDSIGRGVETDADDVSIAYKSSFIIKNKECIRTDGLFDAEESETETPSTPLKSNKRISDSSPLFINSHDFNSMNSSQITVKRGGEESSPFLTTLDPLLVGKSGSGGGVCKARIEEGIPLLTSLCTINTAADDRNSDLLKDLADNSFTKVQQMNEVEVEVEVERSFKLPSSPDISKRSKMRGKEIQGTPDGFWEINFTPSL